MSTAMRSDIYIFIIDCIEDMFETCRCDAAEISEGISSDAHGIDTDGSMRDDFIKGIDERLDDMIADTDSLRKRMIYMKSLVWIRRRVDELLSEDANLRVANSFMTDIYRDIESMISSDMYDELTVAMLKQAEGFAGDIWHSITKRFMTENGNGWD